MQTRRLVPLFVALLACALMMFAVSAGAQAQDVSVRASFANPPKEPIAINVLVGQSRVINFDKPIGRFSVSNPDVAEAVLVPPDQVLVNGKAFGQVNFIAWEKEKGQFVVFDVFVRANLSLIDSQIHALFPKDDIRLSQANGSVVISGSVTNPVTAQQAEQVVKAAGFQTVNMLASPVKNVAQVQLQVGGAMSGTFTSALNLFVMGGNTMAMIRAMQQQGALRLLAEPNLIAMDGQQ